MDRARAEGWSRDGLLVHLAGKPGFYVPSFFVPGPGGGVAPLVPGHEKVERTVVADLDRAPFPTRHVQGFGSPVHDRLALEIARGCTRGCRFCQAGMIYRPVRERSPGEVADLLVRGLAETGYEEMSFLSLSTGDYSALEDLFDRTFAGCRAEQVSISLPSLRAGSVSDRLMAMMASLKRTGATVAPEAATQRLRDVINKGIGEEELLGHTAGLFARGWRHVKLYFMIGLPTETDDDVRAIADLCARVQASAGKDAKRVQVTASVSPFVPKPHTPFQWEAMDPPRETRRKIALLREAARANRRLKLRWHDPDMSFLEGVFSRGDRRLAEAVEAAFARGALFSSWHDHLDLDTWMAAFSDAGLDPEPYLASRDPEKPLPWEHLDAGVSRRFLLGERRRAMEAGLTPDCRFGACRECGACAPGPKEHLPPGASSDAGLRPRVVLADRDQAPDTRPGTETGTRADDAARRPAPPRTEETLGRKAGHYRVWYERSGPAAHLSALEMARNIERGLRRARVAMTFSKGYSPSPLLSFDRALPVGVASRCEWFNLFTRREYDPEELLSRLCGVFPRGIRATAVEPLSMGRKQPQAAAEDYLLEVGADADTQAVERAAARVEEFLGAGEYPVEFSTRKGPRTRDLRPMVADFQWRGPGQALVRLDWSRGYMSPLRLLAAVLGLEEGASCLGLTKLAQHFVRDQ
jgi:radical SAM-linked protein